MTKNTFCIMAALWLALICLGSAPVPGQAETERPGMDLYLDGLESYDRGAYQEALGDFSKAIEKDGNNLEFQYRFALTYSRLGRDLEATSILRAVIARDKERYASAYFDLAAIYSRKNDYPAALTVLNDAEKSVPDTARVMMEKGLIHYKMKNYPAAEEQFKKVLALYPDSAQNALYHLGIVALGKNDQNEAVSLFKQAVAINPKTETGIAAKKALDNAGALRRAAKPWHVIADFSYAYDNNIPNDPLDAPGLSSSPATDLGDQYQTLGVNGWVAFALSGNLGLDAGYALNYLRYNDSDNGNVFGNSPYLALKYSGKPWSADMRYTYSYYTEDGHRKLSQNAVIPTVRIEEPYGMMSSMTLGYVHKNYLDHGETPDAVSLFAKARQMFKIPGKEIRPVIGIGYGDEDADTDESSYNYYEIMAGVSFALPYGCYADVSGTALFSDYDVVYGTENREDKGYVVSTSLSRSLFDGVMGRLFYVYVRNDSNVETTVTPVYDPYEYDKHIVKLQVEVSL